MRAARMRNQLLEPVEYRIEETRRGVWRRFLYPERQRRALPAPAAGAPGW